MTCQSLIPRQTGWKRHISLTFKKAIKTNFKKKNFQVLLGTGQSPNWWPSLLFCSQNFSFLLTLMIKTVTAWNMQTLLKNITIHIFLDPNVHLLITAVQWRSFGTRLHRLSEWEVQDQPSFWWGIEWSGKNNNNCPFKSLVRSAVSDDDGCVFWSWLVLCYLFPFSCV